MEFTTTGIVIGGFIIRYYGIILMLGAVAGAFVATRLAARRGISAELVWDAMIWVLILGIIGARLWHIFTPSPSSIIDGTTTQYYLTHPLEMINIRRGGLGIYGAIIGGMIGLYIFSRRRQLDFLVFADIAVPGLALGQAIGRFANYVNGELCGNPTDVPWGITRCFGTGLPAGTKFHPIFLYEMIWSLANMGVLLFLDHRYREKLFPGDLVLIYAAIYSFGRFLIEFIRMDSSMIGSFNANQTFAALIFITSLGILFGRHQYNAIRSR